MTTDSERVAREIQETQRARAAAESSREELKRTVETVGEPLWTRMRLRRVQNSFGEEYELSLIPRTREA